MDPYGYDDLWRKEQLWKLLQCGAAHAGVSQHRTEAADETTYQEAASQFQLKFVEELPFITLYFRLNSIVYASEIQNVSGARDPNPMRNVDKWYINTAGG